MSLFELRQCIEEAAEGFGLCRNRLWEVGSRLHAWEQRFGTNLKQFLSALTHQKLRAALAHEEHSSCTYDFCEFSTRNFTAVHQLHVPVAGENVCVQDTAAMRESHEQSITACRLLKNKFPDRILVEAVNSGKLTAWALRGENLIQHPQTFMAVSHVWSDGTGAGAWEPGSVNECLFAYFRALAEKFECQGIWWDTLCVPSDKLARQKALSNMDLNYQYARVTLVHDRFLKGLPFRNPEIASLAVILSPWFSRGWTALELAKSPKVKIIFCDSIKDLDEDIIKGAPKSAPNRMISSLRKGNVKSLSQLLDVLGPRHTSWAKDQAVISALLVGVRLDDINKGSPDTFQREIYQAVFRKLGSIAYGHLFHNSITMSVGFTWSPANPFRMPQDWGAPNLRISSAGDVIGIWYVISSLDFHHGSCVWDTSHPLVEACTRHALSIENRSRHVILLIPSEFPAKRGLLVEVFQDTRSNPPSFKCRYVGALRFKTESCPTEINRKEKVISIGNTKGWHRLEENQDAWELLKTYQSPADEMTAGTLDLDKRYFIPGGGWTESHHAAWTDVNLELTEFNTQSWNQVDEQGRLPLHLAAERGRVHLVRLLLSASNANARDNTGRTPLHYAALGGSLETVELLLNLDADIEARDQDGEGLIHIAANAGHCPVVCRFGTNTNIFASGKGYMTPLTYAVLGGHADTVECILDQDVENSLEQDVDPCTWEKPWDSWTPLHCAAACGHMKIAKKLIRHKPSAVGSKDSLFGWTPLHFAAVSGTQDMVSLLVSYGADMDTRDTFGWSAKRLAELRQYNKTTEKPQDSELLDGRPENWSILHLAAMGDIKSELRRFITHPKILAGESMPSNRAVGLFRAATHGYHHAVDLFMRQGEGKSFTHGPTPLHAAALEGHEKVALVLLYHGANKESLDPAGDQPIHFAAARGHHGIVSLLLQNGADPAQKGKRGATPLRLAMHKGHAMVVDMLLEIRGIFEAQAKAKDFALLCAVQSGNEEMVCKTLEKRGNIDTAAVPGDNEAIFEALEAGRSGSLRQLFARGLSVHTSVNAGGPRQYWKPLHIASLFGHPDLVKTILAEGAEIDTGAMNNNLRMSMTGAYTHQELVAYVQKNLITSLHLAAKMGQLEIVNLLLEYGASALGNSRWYNFPIVVAARNNHESIVGRLVEITFQKMKTKRLRKFRGPLGKLLLDHAASQGNEDMVRILLDKLPKLRSGFVKALDLKYCRMDDDFTDFNKYFPRFQDEMWRPAPGEKKTAEFLILPRNQWHSSKTTLGRAVQLEGYTGRLSRTTSLYRQRWFSGTTLGKKALRDADDGTLEEQRRSFWQRRLNIIKMLLESGADPNAQDVTGSTALHYAWRLDPPFVDAARLLLEAGASTTTIRDVQDLTPLDVAKQRYTIYHNTKGWGGGGGGGEDIKNYAEVIEMMGRA